MNKIKIITGGSRIGYELHVNWWKTVVRAAILDINGFAAYQRILMNLAMNPDCIYHQGDITGPEGTRHWW